MKILVIFSNLGPYHLARLTHLHKHLLHKGWALTSVELARQEIDYAWKAEINNLPFEHISVVKDRLLEQTEFRVLISSLYKVLSTVNPDIIAVAGYGRASILAATFWGNYHHKPIIVFSASNEHDAPRTFWGEAIKRWLVKHYRAAVVGGKSQKRYLEKLGMKSDAIFFGYNTVDNQAFQPSKIRMLPRPVSKPYFLAINRFVAKKNLSLLLTSYAKYQNSYRGQAWDLVLCGDGILRRQLENQIATLNLQNCVHLPGFLQQEQLLPYLAHASCFVHASIEEQWGLVINEAMASGLPVILSDRCGCFEDLLVEGVNGFGFDPINGQRLTELMIKASALDTDLLKMGEAALKHIQQFSPDYFASSLIKAVEYSLQFDRQ